MSLDPIVGSALVTALRRLRRPTVESDANGLIRLGLHPAYLGFVAFGATFGLGMLSGSVIVLHREPAPLAIACLVFGSLSFVLLWASWDGFFIRLEANQAELRRSSPFGSTVIPWAAVTSISHEPLLSLFTVRSGGSVVRFTVYRHGLASLSSIASRNLPEKLQGMAYVIGAEGARPTAA